MGRIDKANSAQGAEPNDAVPPPCNARPLGARRGGETYTIGVVENRHFERTDTIVMKGSRRGPATEFGARNPDKSARHHEPERTGGVWHHPVHCFAREPALVRERNNAVVF